VALANNVAQAPPPAPSVIAADIDRLTTCFRFVLMDGAVVAKMFAQVQPLLVKVLDAYPGKESLCEKICRCYKHSIRSCRTGFIQILPAMTAHLAEQFRKTPVAAFLYAGAICFSDFAREDNGAHIQLLYTLEAREGAGRNAGLRAAPHIKGADATQVQEGGICDARATRHVESPKAAQVDKVCVDEIFSTVHARSLRSETKALSPRRNRALDNRAKIVPRRC
jgi:hypothetical protein